MSLNSFIIVPRTVYGEPSGEYDGSSLDWHTLPTKASDYYRYTGIETVYFNVVDFTGLITIQGTHDQNPDYNSPWVNIIEYGDLNDSTPVTDYHPITLFGNWAWVRAQIQNFESGEIKAVTLVY